VRREYWGGGGFEWSGEGSSLSSGAEEEPATAVSERCGEKVPDTPKPKTLDNGGDPIQSLLGRGGGREQEGGYTGKETKTMVKSWV